MKDIAESFKKLREAGMGIYDHIDVDEYMRFLRDDDYEDGNWTCKCGRCWDLYIWRCPECKKTKP